MRRAHYAKSRNKKPLFAAVAAIVIVATMIGGAFAWSDFSQSKTNKFRGTTDADVTLHDEFDGVNKDVFVENSGTSTLYVRVRLDEYMEIGGESFVNTANVKDKSTWMPHTYDAASHLDCEHVDALHMFHSYYTWEMSGAERNFAEGTPGLVYSKLKDDPANPGKQIVDTNPTGGKPTQAAAKPILMSDYIRISVWLAGDPARDETMLSPADLVTWTAYTSGCWILDNHADGGGWAYWSRPLAPGTATNLLLDSVNPTTKEPDDDWYYGIDVKLQAVTSNDFAKWGGTPALGYTISADAQKLIDTWTTP